MQELVLNEIDAVSGAASVPAILFPVLGAGLGLITAAMTSAATGALGGPVGLVVLPVVWGVTAALAVPGFAIAGLILALQNPGGINA